MGKRELDQLIFEMYNRILKKASLSTFYKSEGQFQLYHIINAKNLKDTFFTIFSVKANTQKIFRRNKKEPSL